MQGKQPLAHPVLSAGANKRSPARAILMACTAAVLVAASGCSEQRPDTVESAGEKLSGRVSISGSRTMAPLIVDVAKDFKKLHPGVDIVVEATSAGEGLREVREGKADIGMVTHIIPSEASELLPFLIARDGIAISLHAENPVKSLSRKQVADIYTKKITNWREVGGRDSSIYVIATPPAAGSTALFMSYWGIEEADLRADLSVIDVPTRFAALTGNVAGIMYSSLSTAEQHTAEGGKLRMLPVEGVAASSANLGAGRYPLARPLALVTRGMPSGPAKAFIDHARSPAATPFIERYGFVPYRD